MEAAAAGTLTGLFAQLGIAGIILAVLIAGAVWYLKASKDLREEKRSVISDLKAELKAATDERNRLQMELYRCQYPEWGMVTDEQA
ncbi:hypothetical protein AOC05_04895 [Arthrobacter alpinus]|uniref:Uncharacterized protein n=1 Tax=Arthrobacter alpinus TaxID=656366 RepID=A0A0M4QLN0_9MICC|nr:hypothetical protein [Arthrobacter alpinus]ALE91810.1 hypothetical protein AOC05_04895 [Arthrobacter alpinus]